MSIKVMDEALTNKIAAGEVVERPRSIVKELVENALDANASEIKIKLVQAGIQKITVIDNGTGMSEADAALAFVRHATSKIFTEADLFSIHTLGFRGEALAAIAAVSKVKMITGMKHGSATEVLIEGGTFKGQRTVDSRVGTVVEVRQLFYNTPARLKHLKSLQTEYMHTLDYVQKMALARPDVRFEFVHDEKLVFKTYGTGHLAQTLVMIYGEKIADYLYAVEACDADFTVSGMISHPQMQRSHNRVMHLTINGRSIKSFGLNYAILQGYGNLLPKGMYPIVALDVKVDPKLVDVNVHPAKLEVRVSEEKALQHLMTDMIKGALARENLIYKEVRRPQQIQMAEQVGLSLEYRPQRVGTSLTDAHDVKSARHGSPGSLNHSERAVAAALYHIPDVTVHGKSLQMTNEDSVAGLPIAEVVDKRELRSQEDEGKDEKTATQTFIEARKELRALHIIGQFDATYILAQADNTLFVIDQHAAQERIRYDQHMHLMRTQQSVASQSLLFPFTVFLEPREMAVLSAQREALTKHGLVYEDFSQQEVRINAVPAWIQQESIETYVRKVIDCVVQYEAIDAARIREKELIMLSCRYSIKAHDVLSHTEMVQLIEQLSETPMPFTCPHGRPIVVKHSLYEVEKWFKRV